VGERIDEQIDEQISGSDRLLSAIRKLDLGRIRDQDRGARRVARGGAPRILPWLPLLQSAAINLFFM
jgi:hypothetical protein